MNSSCSGSSRSNQLLSDGTYWYQYDPEGNRTARWIDVDQNGLLDSGDADITQYAWDNRNRLTEVSHFADFASLGESDPDSIVDYLYDAENRWIGRDIDSDGDGQIDHQIRFAYDGNQIVLEFDKDLVGSGEHGEANQLTVVSLSHRYLWQPGAVDQLMADEQLLSSPEGGEGQGGNGRDKGYDLSQPGEVAWALSDHLGTVRDLAVYDAETNLTTVANHRVCDSFGNLKSQTNAAVDCLFGFTGRPLDNATGLQNNLNRWYDAKVGRWVSEDPIRFEGQDANEYRYVGNDPTTIADPVGLQYPTNPHLAVQEGYYWWFDQPPTAQRLTPAEVKFYLFVFECALIPDDGVSRPKLNEVIKKRLEQVNFRYGYAFGAEGYFDDETLNIVLTEQMLLPGRPNRTYFVLPHELTHAVVQTLWGRENDKDDRVEDAMASTILAVKAKYRNLMEYLKTHTKGEALNEYPDIRTWIRNTFLQYLRDWPKYNH